MFLQIFKLIMIIEILKQLFIFFFLIIIYLSQDFKHTLSIFF